MSLTRVGLLSVMSTDEMTTRDETVKEGRSSSPVSAQFPALGVRAKQILQVFAKKIFQAFATKIFQVFAKRVIRLLAKRPTRVGLLHV